MRALACGLAVLVLAAACGGLPGVAPKPTPVQPGVGEEGRIQIPVGTSVLMASDRAGLDEYSRALTADLAKTPVGTSSDAMRASGRIIDVPTNTRLVVLEEDLNATRVRLVDAGPLSNREGWVRSAAVFRPRASSAP